MSDPVLWNHEFASGESSADFAFPSDAAWVQCVGPGTIVLVENGGRSFTRHAVGGDLEKRALVALRRRHRLGADQRRRRLARPRGGAGAPRPPPAAA